MCDYKVVVVLRLIEVLMGEWGMVMLDIIVDCLIFFIVIG